MSTSPELYFYVTCAMYRTGPFTVEWVAQSHKEVIEGLNGHCDLSHEIEKVSAVGRQPRTGGLCESAS